MNIKFYTFTIIICIIFASALTACTKKDGPADIDTSIETIYETEPSETTDIPDTEETEPTQTENDESVRVPIENEKALEFIEFQYKKALDIIDIVENGTLDADMSIEYYDEEGVLYYPVNDTNSKIELDGATITSFDDLKTYINSVFARAIADDLISAAKQHYKDIDGTLYVKAKIQEEDIYEPETSESEEESTPTDEEIIKEPQIIKTEFFLSKFTDKLFRYTAKVTYEAPEDTDEETTEGEENKGIAEIAEYYDFIFQNTGSGWYWTAFPK
ncbi:MAG: hypothetical protein IKT56_05370 [Clostridia bacterium]|nr:hypothetical protein [Clostridia bacterium]